MRGRFAQLVARYPGWALGGLMTGILSMAAVAWAGFMAGLAAQPGRVIDQLQAQWVQEQAQYARLEQQASDDLNALAFRLGQLQAHVMRLDALGGRLTEIAELDGAEFDFEHRPALGGPAEVDGGQTQTEADVLAALGELQVRLEQREEQLTALETLLMNRNLLDEVRPDGRPVTSGWISSYFGKRTDPFTGKKAMHKGMDFAGKEGSEIVAVAPGIVSLAEERSGYGYLVELRHGNGYTTRYGHNKEMLVQVGDRVEKGQTIALMGSTGRSTGPHVHFEVVRNGKTVNPANYLSVSR